MQYFHVKTDVLMERDLAAGVVHLLDKEGSRNVLVFADEHVAQHPAVAKMLSAAEGPGREIKLRSIPSGEPTTGLVNELAGIYRGRGLDMFVAIGGGSVLDLAKAVSALIENEGVIEDYQGTSRQLTAGVKKICIPTTAGTGCEISGAAVLINTRSAFKRGVVGPGVVPTYALLCAELGASLPVDLTVGCGMDAIVHAVESYVSPKANELTRLFSREAFLRLYETGSRRSRRSRGTCNTVRRCCWGAAWRDTPSTTRAPAPPTGCPMGRASTSMSRTALRWRSFSPTRWR